MDPLFNRRNIYVQKPSTQSLKQIPKQKDQLTKILENNKLYSQSKSKMYSNNGFQSNAGEHSINKTTFEKFKAFQKKPKEFILIQSAKKQQELQHFSQKNKQSSLQLEINISNSIQKKSKINYSRDYSPLNIVKKHKKVNHHSCEMKSMKNSMKQSHMLLSPRNQSNINMINNQMSKTQQQKQAQKDIKQQKRRNNRLRRASMMLTPNQYSCPQIIISGPLKHNIPQENFHPKNNEFSILNKQSKQPGIILCQNCKKYLFQISISYVKKINFKIRHLKDFMQKLKQQINSKFKKFQNEFQTEFKIQVQKLSNHFKNNVFFELQTFKKSRQLPKYPFTKQDTSFRFGDQSEICKKSDHYFGSEMDQNYFNYGSQQSKITSHQYCKSQKSANSITKKVQKFSPPKNIEKHKRSKSRRNQDQKQQQTNYIGIKLKNIPQNEQNQLRISLIEKRKRQNDNNRPCKKRSQSNQQTYRNRSRQLISSARTKYEFQNVYYPNLIKSNYQQNYEKIKKVISSLKSSYLTQQRQSKELKQQIN